MNGILGSFQTSYHDVSVQLMRKFSSMQQVCIDQWPDEFKDEFLPMFQERLRDSGSLSESTSSTDAPLAQPLPPLSEKAFYDYENHCN